MSSLSFAQSVDNGTRHAQKRVSARSVGGPDAYVLYYERMGADGEPW
jgi:hypothetical protein